MLFLTVFTQHSFYNIRTLLCTFHCVFLVCFFVFYLAALGLCCCAQALSSCGSGGHSWLQCAGSSLRWPLPFQSTGSRHTGFSSCGTWAQQLWLAGSRAQAEQVWCAGPAAPRHMGSSQSRTRTHVPCTGRRTPNH